MTNPAMALDDDVPVRYLVYAAVLVMVLLLAAAATVVWTLHNLWS